MEALIVGVSEATSQLAARLAPEAVEARTFAARPEPDGIPALAAAMLELEHELTERRPAAVVLADSGDAALAAALVATKLLVPVFAAGARASGAGTQNDRLLGLLAEPATAADLPKLLSR